MEMFEFVNVGYSFQPYRIFIGSRTSQGSPS